MVLSMQRHTRSLESRAAIGNMLHVIVRSANRSIADIAPHRRPAGQFLWRTGCDKAASGVNRRRDREPHVSAGAEMPSPLALCREC